MDAEKLCKNISEEIDYALLSLKALLWLAVKSYLTLWNQSTLNFCLNWNLSEKILAIRMVIVSNLNTYL